jgi:hypothetical protein
MHDSVRPLELERAAWRCACAVSGMVLLGIIATAAAMTHAAGGHFVYTLDDPYIHLQLARTLASSGTYGLSGAEASAPSSSILWPLLLVPFARMSAFEFVPLVIGTASMLLLPFVIADGLSRAVIQWRFPGGQATKLLRFGVIVGVLAANPVGLVMTGMEHPLQVLAAAIVASGLLALAAGARPLPLLSFALALGPLIRFENTALILAAAPLLIRAGSWRMLLAVMFFVAATLGGFAAFLVAQGLDPLPSSVIEKSHLEGRLLAGRVMNLTDEFDYVPFWALLALPLLAFALMLGLRDTRMRLLLLGCALLASVHLVAGRLNWGARYEVYVFAFAVPVIVLAIARRWQDEKRMSRRVAPAMVVGASVIGAYLLDGILDAPARARAIQVQPAQLARFVAGYWRAAVAVNDIGLVGWRGGDVPVLDLIGLASRPVRRARSGAEGEGAMVIAELARAENVQVALFYPEWMQGHLPPHWIPIAQLVTTGSIGNLGGRIVSIYATVPEAVEPLRAKLRAFAVDLPVETRLEFEVSPG